MPEPPEHSDAPAELRDLRFAPAYRLTMVLEPDGCVREVLLADGIEGGDVRSFRGRHVADIAAGGPRGSSRAGVWRDRVRAASLAARPITELDHRPGQPTDQPRLVECTLTPIRDPAGVLQSILLDLTDGTARRDAEMLARAQRDQLRDALALTGLGTYAIYLREARMDADARFEEIYGFDAQSFIETEGFDGFFEVMHADDRARVRADFEASITGGAGFVTSYRLWARRPDGPELRWIQAVGRIEQDEAGPFRAIGVIDDVTDRRREDDARLRMQKREAIGTLAGGVAHDFNNVISAIVSNAAVAETELQAGASPATSIREIGRAARRAADLVQRLLVFSREEEPRNEAFDLGGVVQESCALLRPTLPPGITLIESVGRADLSPALGDSSGLHQVVMNLVNNASQAIAAETTTGAIEVMLDDAVLSAADAPAPLVAGRYLRLRVIDDGPGISDRVLHQMFDPFFTTKPVGQGTGLGLTAAQSIVRTHGGAMTVDTSLGDGTVFTILLPEAPAGATLSEPHATAAAERRGARVLFVDDETALARLAERAMPVHGCTAITFNDPVAALAAFRAAPGDFDALVTDLSMPALTGLELAAAIRELAPGLPTVLTSGYLSPQSRAEVLLGSVDRVVPKPCSIAELAQAVLELVASRAGSA